MAKVKVGELAKELGQKPNNLISFLRERGVDVVSKDTVLDDEGIRVAESFFGKRKIRPEQKNAVYDSNGNPVKIHADAEGRPIPLKGGYYDFEGNEKHLIVDENGYIIKRKLDENGKPIPYEGKMYTYDKDCNLVPYRKLKKKTEPKPEEKPEKTAEKKETTAAVKEEKERPKEEAISEAVTKDNSETPAVNTPEVSGQDPETASKAGDAIASETPAPAPKKRQNVYRERAEREEKARLARQNQPETRTSERTDRTSGNGDRPRRDGGYGQRREGGNGGFGQRREGGNSGFRNQNRTSGGFGKPGFGGPGFDKDKDSDEKRTFTRRNDHKPAGSSIKSDFAKDMAKDQRATAFSERNRDKNRKNRGDFEEENNSVSRKHKDPNRAGAFQRPVAVKKPEEDPDEIKTISVPDMITIRELADKLRKNATDIVKKLFLAGKLVNVNSEIPYEEAENIAMEYNCIVEKETVENVVENLMQDTEDNEELLVKRPPIVCVMGHVDHGKTSILDAIRKTNVTSREAGGITQHIGAYMVEINGEKITFLDTPGHEAFTTMRMRGAKSTDVAVLVVAADDGVMPQTIEAINHAKAAGVQIVVAMNKMDKEGANPDKVLTELSEQGLISESWGGDTVVVPVSAKTGEGIEQLLEMILLTSEVLELKANPDRLARGIVVESKLDKGRGPVATVLIQKGTLHVGDNVAIGSAYGKVRAMINDKGVRINDATPSTPVEILGLNNVPGAGDTLVATENDKEARNIAEAYIALEKEKLNATRVSLEGLFDNIQAGNVKDLNIIIKADVMGSVEAVKQSLLKLSNDEVKVKCIHGAVGNINESDVILASASGAIIIGFNVKPDNTAKDTAEREKVDIRLYNVIYNAIDDIEAAMNGMLDPVYEEVVIGHAEVRQTFKASGVGLIAGSYVLDGKVIRGSKARISRDGNQLFDGDLASLKRFKDDVKEVNAGYECGLVFEKFSDLLEGDQIEFYQMQEVPRNREKKQY